MFKLRLFSIMITAVVLFITAPAYAQNLKTVKGIVNDKSGSPIEGATILVVGANRAATTNSAGEFSLSAAQGETIEITRVGYTPSKVMVIAGRQINVSLEESVTDMDEVVVVGYGQTTRKNITNAQTTIKEADINRTVNTTIDQAIQGRAAGVQVTTNSGEPGGSISVFVRGLSSITGSTEPLYVIDGMQMQQQFNKGLSTSSSSNPLADLNPSDVESIEILQGPSATSVYGSRATNGVVLITTKKGKAGDSRINYNFLYTLQDVPREIPVLNFRDYTIMLNELRRLRGQAPRPEYLDSTVLGDGTNWQRAVFNRAPLVKHQISFSGGNDKTRYYLSGEHFKQDGVIVGSGFNRNSIRLNLDNNIKKWLKVGVNLSGSQTKQKFSTVQNHIVRLAVNMPPVIPLYNPDGSFGGYPLDMQQQLRVSDDINPFAKAKLYQNNMVRKSFNVGTNATVFLLKGLEFRTTVNAGYNFGNTTNFTPTYTIGTKINSKAEQSKSSTENFYWNWNQLLEYKTVINADHSLRVMVSHESQESRAEGLNGYRTGFPFNELPGGMVPPLGLGDALGERTGGYQNWWAMESYLGRLNYGFRNKYLLELAYRTDGSVNFGGNNRWASFPSGSVAWRVIEESFMKNQDLISDLKLRFEAGITGNQGDGAGLYSPLMPVATPWGNGFYASRYGNSDIKWEETMTYNIGFNLGLFKNRITLEGDFYDRTTDNLLMENALPYFMGTMSDIPGAIRAPIVNLGILKNNGWAFTLNTLNIDRKDFKWNTNFNISGNTNKIVKFYQETAVIDRLNYFTGGLVQRSAVGEPAWQFYGYVYDGIFKTLDEVNNSAVPEDGQTGQRIETSQKGIWVGDYKYKDLNGDGLINTLDQTYIGNPFPKFTGGFTNSFVWKNIDVSILFTGSYGGKIYNGLRFANLNPSAVYGAYNALQEATGFARVVLDDNGLPVLLNKDATVARPEGNNGNFSRRSNMSIEDGSYIKFKNLTISYLVPSAIMRRQKIVQGVKLGFGAQNLFTITKYKGYDPEIGADVGGSSILDRRTYGTDVGQYPQTKMYTFNLNVTF